MSSVTETSAAAGPGSAAEPASLSGAAPPPAVGTRSCANCGAPLIGKYCSECGQRHHDKPVHHFGHFISEATEDMTHADSRLWQTLIALLFRPGLLTREFLEGHRVRYLPPVRLYLVISAIFFLVGGLHQRMSNPSIFLSDNGKSLDYHVVTAQRATGPGAVARVPAKVASGVAAGVAAAAPTPAARQRVCRQFGTVIEQHGGWFARFEPHLVQSCLAAFAQGGLERLNEAVGRNLERAMFLFLPLLALVMKPLYLEPPRHYVEHLLFFLHNHAFLFVILGASTVLGMITSSALVLDPIDTVITICIPIYFYRAMRRVYGQGRWLTLSKLSVLGVAYFCLGVVMLVATFSYSFLML